MKKRVYIAGKVTGMKPTEVSKKFATAERQVQAMGLEVVNPIAVVGNHETPWNEAMKKCITALIECDAIILLPCWKDSKGALLEMNIATNMGMEILFL